MLYRPIAYATACGYSNWSIGYIFRKYVVYVRCDVWLFAVFLQWRQQSRVTVMGPHYYNFLQLSARSNGQTQCNAQWRLLRGCIIKKKYEVEMIWPPQYGPSRQFDDDTAILWSILLGLCGTRTKSMALSSKLSDWLLPCFDHLSFALCSVNSCVCV